MGTMAYSDYPDKMSHKDAFHQGLHCFLRQKSIKMIAITVSTVKAPNIAHLTLLTSFGYNKKETKLKKSAQPNRVINIYYLHRVQNEKYFPNL